MRRIRIIATGGTIASQDNGNGLRPTMGPETIVNLAFSEDDEFSTSIRRMVDLGELCFDIKEIMSVDSSDMRPELWNRIGEEIDRCVGERYEINSSGRQELGNRMQGQAACQHPE